MKKVIIVVLVLVVAAQTAMGLATWLGPPEFEKAMEATRQEMAAAVKPPEPASYGPQDLEAVPEPMRTYLKKAMPAQGQRVALTRLTQEGSLKGSEDSAWDSFHATQVIGTSPPQMVWSATAEYFPLMPLTISRTLINGQAEGNSMFWGLVESLHQGGEVFKAYLMLRWLTEAVWHPDAFLPGNGVTWDPEVKETKGVSQVRAILEADGLKVSGVFLFAGKGGAPMLFLSDEGPFIELRVDRFYCNYSDWRKEGRFVVPHELVQGSRRGITDDRRLEIKVKSLEYQ